MFQFLSEPATLLTRDFMFELAMYVAPCNFILFITVNVPASNEISLAYFFII